jgi:hypothetical protein
MANAGSPPVTAYVSMTSSGASFVIVAMSERLRDDRTNVRVGRSKSGRPYSVSRSIIARSEPMTMSITGVRDSRRSQAAEKRDSSAFSWSASPLPRYGNSSMVMTDGDA